MQVVTCIENAVHCVSVHIFFISCEWYLFNLDFRVIQIRVYTYLVFQSTKITNMDIGDKNNIHAEGNHFVNLFTNL